MRVVHLLTEYNTVALRKESVDRNEICCQGFRFFWLSLSARRAWIEIGRKCQDLSLDSSLSARRAWIEIGHLTVGNPHMPKSLSARRAWIEIVKSTPEDAKRWVALRKESVDRNIKGSPYLQIGRQSLSARRAWIEIVSRLAFYSPSPSLSARRAWIEMTSLTFCSASFASLSARRAWIEMMTLKSLTAYQKVALRKESVDRNMS